MTVFLSLLALLVIGFWLTLKFVDARLRQQSFAEAYDDCRKVWSARGLYGEGVDENSIRSIRHAFEEGAMGVEVDVFFDAELEDYIVSHNENPYQLKDGRILPLAELFEAVGEGHYFWLDFKKLRRLDRDQLQKAIARLNEITRVHGLKPRVYVEGENPTNLVHFRRAGFKTIFDTHPAPDDSVLSGFMIAVYKMFFYFGRHTVMGMEYGAIDRPVYGPRTRHRLGALPVFLYHVPVNEELVRELLALPAVRAFIVGSNQSVNLHHLTACDD